MIAYFLGRFKYALRHASQIGKLASSVNLYRFMHFLDFPSGAIFANLLVEEASPIPFERYLRYLLLVHSERFPEKEKTWTTIWHPG